MSEQSEPSPPFARRWPEPLKPLALASGRGQALAVAGCLLTLALLFGAEAISRRGDALAVLTLLPILGAAWLVSSRMLAVVLAAALALDLAAAWLGIESRAGTGSSLVAGSIVVLAVRRAANNLATAARSEWRAALVARVARIATSAGSLQEILDGILAEMARDDLRGGLIGLIDESDHIYPAAAEGDISPEVWASRIPVGEGVMGTAAAEGRSVLIRDLDDATLPVRPVNRSLGSNSRLKSMVVVPLLAAGRVIGVLEIDSGRPARFDESDLAVLEQVALAISGAVQREGALKLADLQLQRRVRELTLLLEAARELAGSLDPAVVLERVLTGAEAALPGGRAALVRVDEEQLLDILEHEGDGVRARPLHLARAFAPPALLEALTEGGVHTSTEPEGASELLPSGAQACIWAPIRVGTRIHGVLLVSSGAPEAVDDGTLRLVEGVAYLAGLALGNAGRLDLERRRGIELREHADKMASLEKVKADFLKVASHELRGPLAVLRGYISMLADGSISEQDQVQGILAILGTKLGEINDLVEQMLETARLEDSQLLLHLRHSDLADIVRQAAQRSQEKARAHHRLVVFGTETGPVPVHVDSGRVQTIVANLIDNALKYSPAGGEVRVIVEEGAEEARVVVEDDGLGIATADLPRLFTRFGRIVTSENSHIPGTGLGLYLAREMARLHGGELSGTSVEGRGSTFVLTLPLVSQPAPSPTPRTARP